MASTCEPRIIHSSPLAHDVSGLAAFHPSQPFNGRDARSHLIPTNNEHRAPNGGLTALTYVHRAVSQHLYPWICGCS